MSELHCLVYVSTASDGISNEDLQNILEVSRERNRANSISGLLVFSHDHFIQVLEGKKDAVDNTYRKICEDKRHTNVSRLLFEPLEKRYFPDWSMAFKDQRFDTAEDDGLLDRILNAPQDGGAIEMVSNLFSVFESCLSEN